MAARVEKRIALALPVLRMERLASVMPTLSASLVVYPDQDLSIAIASNVLATPGNVLQRLLT
jgi:hypothetical protein